MRRSASSAENPHIPRPPRPPALLTAAARAGVLSPPIGACRIGHLRLSRSVNAFLDHMDCPPDGHNRAIVRLARRSGCNAALQDRCVLGPPRLVYHDTESTGL